MLQKAKEHLKAIWGDNPPQINGLSYTLDQQESILYSHLILMNHGFGHPHTFWSLGERLLGLWVNTLIDAHDGLTEIGEATYLEQLNAFYKNEAEKLFQNKKTFLKTLNKLQQPLGKNHFAVPITNARFSFIDLFAGIGGFHQAMHSVGGRCVFASEWDKYARVSYKENYREIAEQAGFPVFSQIS